MNIEARQAGKDVNSYWASAECVEKYDAKHAEGIGYDLDDAVWLEEFKRYVPSEGKRLLDLGCGTGFASLLLAESGFEVTGVDQSENMLNEARRKAKERDVAIDWNQGDLVTYEPKEASFDVVVARWVFWTLPDPVTVLQNAYKALKPGGSIVIFDGTWAMNPETSGKEEAEEPTEKEATDKRTEIWKSVYTPELLKSLPLLGETPTEVLAGLMRDAGFKNLESAQMDYANEMYRKHRGDGWKESQMYYVRAVK